MHVLSILQDVKYSFFIIFLLFCKFDDWFMAIKRMIVGTNNLPARIIYYYNIIIHSYRNVPGRFSMDFVNISNSHCYESTFFVLSSSVFIS